MATFPIALDACLKCDYRRVEVGDTVRLNLDPDKFDAGTIASYSPVPAQVLEVRLPEPPEPLTAVMTIVVEVADPDLPPGHLLLEADDIASVTCYDCCTNLTERIEVLEEEALYFDYEPTITGLTGGGSTKLDGILTAGLAVGRIQLVRQSSGIVSLYRLSSGSTPDNSPIIIRPDDYHASTNAKQWVLQSSMAQVVAGKNVSIQSSAGRDATIDADSLTDDRYISLPNADGVLVLGNGAGVSDQPAFRAAIGCGSAATMNQNEFAPILPAITGFLGGGATNLDGVTTSTMTLGSKRTIYVSSKEYVYELSAGTNATSSPAIIRPTDYNSTTNARVWKLRHRYTQNTEITGTSIGGFGTADSGKIAIFQSNGDLSVSERLVLADVAGGFSCDVLFGSVLSGNRLIQIPDNDGVFALTQSPDGYARATDILWSSTNDSATAGDIGEFAQSLVTSSPGVTLLTATATNVTSIALTAGDWDVEGAVNFSGTSSTVTVRQAGISATSATLPTDGSQVHNGYATTTTSEISSVTLPRKRISLAAPATIYLVASATFSAGSMTSFGQISARRVR